MQSITDFMVNSTLAYTLREIKYALILTESNLTVHFFGSLIQCFLKQK